MTERRDMAAALLELESRLKEWQDEGMELQEQLVRLSIAVFLDDRPLTEKEQEWARKLGEELKEGKHVSSGPIDPKKQREEARRWACFYKARFFDEEHEQMPEEEPWWLQIGATGG
jgi:hypothetical protein